MRGFLVLLFLALACTTMAEDPGGNKTSVSTNKTDFQKDPEHIKDYLREIDSVIKLEKKRLQRKQSRLGKHSVDKLKEASELSRLRMELLSYELELASVSEQTKINRRRLELEQRKVDLMQAFFPKFLEQQAQLLKLSTQQPLPGTRQFPEAGQPHKEVDLVTP